MDIYLLLRYFACKTTPEEERHVREWILDDKDGSRAELYRDTHIIYQGMVLHSEGQMTPAATPPRIHRPRWKSVGTRILKVAAIAVLIIGATVWSRISVLDSISSQSEIIRVPAGERMDMILADGTHLWMNSGTEVELPVIFSRKHRNIKVNEGEVLLDVAKNEDKPFFVDTWAGTVKVLGTRFEVTADEKKGDFSASLIRGSIRVTSKLNPEDDYTLVPDEMVRLENGSLKHGRIKNITAIGCWSEGLIDVTEVSFEELMSKFEKAFDVRIIIDRDNMPLITYTRGKIRISDGLEHALSMLELGSDFRYRIDTETATVHIY